MNKNANDPRSLSPASGFPDESPKSSGFPDEGPKGIATRPGQVICGDLDMRIDRNGVWYYHGSPIGRKELLQLFASVLRRDEAGDYWLITPAEVGRIEVEDAPFLAVELLVSGAGAKQVIDLRTNIDKIVAVDQEHPIRVDIDPETAQPSPYVVMGGGIEALLARPVYYDLVEHGTEEKIGDEDLFGVWSRGAFFVLGTLDAGG